MPGQELIGNFATTRATLRLTFVAAVQFLREGQFQAAVNIASSLDSPAPSSPHGHQPVSQFAWIHKLGAFWGAWDRLDYREAANVAAGSASWDVDLVLQPLVPDNTRLAFLQALAADPPSQGDIRAVWLRKLAADLLANARRRLKQGHLEDALLRAYRVLELIGQIRLFLHGLDSAQVDPNHPRVKEWLAYKQKQGRPVPVEPGKPLQLGKTQVASLLRHMGEPLGQRLCDPKSFPQLNPNTRNHSLLIDGFEAKAVTQEVSQLSALLDQLRQPFLRGLRRQTRQP